MGIRKERRWNKRAAAIDTPSTMTSLTVKQLDKYVWEEATNKIELLSLTVIELLKEKY